MPREHLPVFHNKFRNTKNPSFTPEYRFANCPPFTLGKRVRYLFLHGPRAAKDTGVKTRDRDN